MPDTKAVLIVAEKAFHIFGITAILLFSALFSAEIRAQDSLRNTVYGGKPAAPRRAGKPKIAVRRNIPRKPVRRTVKASDDNSTKNRKNLLTVTFTSKEPKTEIWLNEKKIGVTGDALTLTKKLAAGEYKVLAKTSRQVFFPTQKITVTPEKTEFQLIDPQFLKPKTPPVAVVPPKQAEKSDLEIAREVSAKVKEILGNYADPKKTDSVTLKDWETVFQAAQLGQLQNYTAIQVEAHRWFASGQIELAKNEIPNALTAFQKAQEFMTNSALPFYGLGNTYFTGKQYQDALKSYQRAAQIAPKFAPVYRKLGDTYRILSKEKEAINAYKTAIFYGYDTTETRYLLGTMYLQNKQFEEGVAQLETVVKESPKPEVYIAIGEAYEKLKRGVSAIENYQKAIYLEPASAAAYYKLGIAYLEQREYVKAKESLEKAIGLDAEGKIINRAESQKKLREAASKINR